MIAPSVAGADRSLKFTPNGQLSLSTGCVFDAPTFRQNGSPLTDLFAPKNSPSFTGSVTTPALFVTSAFTVNSTVVQTTQHLECFQGFKGLATALYGGRCSAAFHDVMEAVRSFRFWHLLTLLEDSSK